MNKLEREMVESLTELKEKHGAVEVKAEFESEGARLNELMRLKDISSKCGMGIVLKIGGPEAIRDMFDARWLGVSGLVAPMVESAYALTKFLDAIEKYIPEDEREDIDFAVNVETIQAYQNFSAMLKLPKINLLKRITVGRVDLSGSMGLKRKDINSDKVFEITKIIFEKTKKAKMGSAMGGAISPQAVPFISKLVDASLLDRFETRKVVFSAAECLKDAEGALRKANSFELLWLANKHDLHNAAAYEDKDRIRMLEMRSRH